MTFSKKVAQYISDHPVTVVAVFATVFIASVPPLLDADIYLSIYELSPRAEYYDHFTTLNGELGWDNLGAILLTLPADKADGQVTDPRPIREMHAVEQELRQLDFVTSTLSMATLVQILNERPYFALQQNIPGGVPGLPGAPQELQPREQLTGFPEEGPAGDARINATVDLALEVLGDQIYGNILSRDHKSALLVVEMVVGASGPEYRDWQRILLSEGLRLEEDNPYAGELEMRPLSIDIIYTELDDVTLDEAPYWVVAAVLAGTLTLVYLFRRAFETSAALLVLVIVASSTLAAALALDIDFNLLSLLVAALIFAAGVDYAMHVIARYREERELGYGPKNAAHGTIRHTGPALLITTVTDTAGFMSLYFSLIPAIGDFGAMVGVGMFVSFITCLTLLPVLLMWGDRLRGVRDDEEALDTEAIEARRARLEEEVRGRQRSSALGRMGSFLADHRKRVALASLLTILLIASPLAFKGVQVWGASYLEPTPILDEDTYAIQALTHMDQTFGIPNELAVLFYGDATDPQVVAYLDRLQEETNDVHGITKTDSVPNVLRLYTTLINPDPRIDQDGDGLPDTREDIKRAYDEMRNDPATSILVSRVVVYDPGAEVEYPIAAHRLGINPRPANDLGDDVDNYRQSVADMERALAVLSDEEDEAQLEHGTTGLVMLAVEVVDAIVRGNAWAIVIMLGVIFSLLSLFWKSPGLGLLGMVPLSCAIVTQYSLQAVLGYEVTYISLVLTGMVTGIGVDDAVHYINRFREEVRHGRSPRAAASLAQAEIGSVLVGTTVTTLAPFFVILFSVITWAAQTALLVIPTMAMALVGTLLPLPALLAWHAEKAPQAYYRKTIFDESIAAPHGEDARPPGAPAT